MTALYSMFLGRFYLGATLKDFSVNDGGGAQAVALTTGYRYINGYTGEGTNQLCQDWTAKVQALGGNFVDATATFSYSTGLITLDFATHNVDITWTDGDLQTLMGFSGTQTGQSTYVATAQPRYVWRPTRALSDYPTNSTNIWNKLSTTAMVRSADGSVFTLPGTSLNEAFVRFRYLPEADVLTPSTGTIYQDLEKFWSDVFHAGEQFRFYPDRSLNAATSFKTCVYGGDAVGSFRDTANRALNNYNGLWDVEIPLSEVV